MNGVARRMGKVGSPYRTRTQSNSFYGLFETPISLFALPPVQLYLLLPTVMYTSRSTRDTYIRAYIHTLYCNFISIYKVFLSMYIKHSTMYSLRLCIYNFSKGQTVKWYVLRKILHTGKTNTIPAYKLANSSDF